MSRVAPAMRWWSFYWAATRMSLEDAEIAIPLYEALMEEAQSEDQRLTARITLTRLRKQAGIPAKTGDEGARDG